MKRNFSIAALILLVAASTYGQTIRQESQAKSSVPGVWMIDVTPDDVVPPPFTILITFNSDGTLTETQNDMNLPPFPITAGHGLWTSLGNDAAVLQIVQFASDSSGNPIGLLKSKATARVKGSKIDYDINVELVAPDGTVLFTGHGTGSGSRVQ